MAITPTSGPNLSQVGKFMEGKTETARKQRLQPQGRIVMQKQQARAAKSTPRQRSKDAAKQRGERGRNLDVRA